MFCPRAEMAELADAQASGACSRKGVEVRVLFSAPFAFFLTFFTAVTLLSAAQAGLPARAPAQVKGTVVDEQGGAAGDLAVVLFPSDRATWAEARASKRFLLQRAVGGAFAFAEVPEGDYRLQVLTDAQAKDWPDLSLLERLLPRAFPAQVPASGVVTFGLTISTASGAPLLTRVSGSGTIVVNSATGAILGAPPGLLPGGRGAPPPPARPPGPGAVSGTVRDSTGRPVPGLSVQALRPITRNGVRAWAPTARLAVTGADGAYRIEGLNPGDVSVAVISYGSDPAAPAGSTVRKMPPPIVAADGTRTSYLTTFAPNVTAPQAARVLTTGATEIGGVDITIQQGPIVTLTGAVVGGARGAQQIILLNGHSPESSFDFQRASLAPDGQFSFDGVAPGKYLLNLASPAGWAQMTIDVDGTPPGPIKVEPRRGYSVSGRVEFAGTSPAPAGEALRQLLVRVTPSDPLIGAIGTGTAVRPDGQFSVSGLPPGNYRMVVTPPQPWVQITGVIGTTDSMDIPARIDADTTGASILLADRESTVVGSMVSATGASVQQGAALIFPDERAQWGISPRRNRVVSSMPGGSFTVTGLPPGRYRAVALPVLVPATLAFTASYLEQLIDRSTPFEVVVGQTVKLALILAGR